MSKRAKTKSTKQATSAQGYTYVQTIAGVEEYILNTNNLRVLYQKRPNTGVVTTNITYVVGAIDEKRGETGVAHMLEHMLFKPTNFDLKRKTESAAMLFEREVGCNLNANTWKDRTTYYFTYPTDHMNRAVQIEAERMTGVVLTDKELNPERNNVLSEFDMYNGDPHFALNVQMVGTALQSHPYGHETIGYREDIEAYDAEKLELFYRNYYRPDNAVMMVIGDVERSEALKTVRAHFGSIKNPNTEVPRYSIREPKQEGTRRITIERPGVTNIISLGFLHAGFPSREWFVTQVACEILTGTDDSILHRALVDTGAATSVLTTQEPTRQTNLGSLSITLAQGKDLQEIEQHVLEIISELNTKDITKLLRTTKTRLLTQELFNRDHSQHIAQELTEYVASGSWESYAKTSGMLESITTKDMLRVYREVFNPKKLTIGHYRST